MSLEEVGQTEAIEMLVEVVSAIGSRILILVNKGTLQERCKPVRQSRPIDPVVEIVVEIGVIPISIQC